MSADTRPRLPSAVPRSHRPRAALVAVAGAALVAAAVVADAQPGAFQVSPAGIEGLVVSGPAEAATVRLNDSVNVTFTLRNDGNRTLDLRLVATDAPAPPPVGGFGPGGQGTFVITNPGASGGNSSGNASSWSWSAGNSSGAPPPSASQETTDASGNESGSTDNRSADAGSAQAPPSTNASSGNASAQPDGSSPPPAHRFQITPTTPAGPPMLDLSLASDLLTLGPHESASVTVAVSPTADARAGSQRSVTLRAENAENASRASLGVASVHVKSAATPSAAGADLDMRVDFTRPAPGPGAPGVAAAALAALGVARAARRASRGDDA